MPQSEASLKKETELADCKISTDLSCSLVSFLISFHSIGIFSAICIHHYSQEEGLVSLNKEGKENTESRPAIIVFIVDQSVDFFFDQLVHCLFACPKIARHAGQRIPEPKDEIACFVCPKPKYILF